MTLEIAAQRMQPKSWKVHVSRLGAVVEDPEYAGQLASVFGVHSFGLASRIESPEASMPERTDHPVSLVRQASLVA